MNFRRVVKIRDLYKTYRQRSAKNEITLATNIENSENDLPQQEIIQSTEVPTEPQIIDKQEKPLNFLDKSVQQRTRELREAVPYIGSGRRWYDFPYRLLLWIFSGRLRNLWPRRIRKLFNKSINFLHTFNNYDTLKAEPLEDPMRNLIFPEEEKLTQGGLWVVEFFPPSHYKNLLQSLRKNGWDKAGQLFDIYGSNADQIIQTRQGNGYSWSSLGSVASSKSLGYFPDAKRENLPDEFLSIELSAAQIGRSLTAVIAFVRLNDLGQESLNSVWKSKQEPTFEWRGMRRPHVESRLFAAFKSTQKERQRIHDLARDWLRRRCGGFFSNSTLGQPVIDLNIFSSFDPLAEEENLSMRNSLRALGLTGNYFNNYVSPQIPGGAIIPPDSLILREGILQNCWGVAAPYDELSRRLDEPGYGEKPYSAMTLAGILNSPMRALALHVAVQAYITEVRKTYAVLIDEARSHYGKYNTRRLQQLRSSLLATSLDLPSVAKDTATLWSDNWKYSQGIEILSVASPEATLPNSEKSDFIKTLGKRRELSFAILLEDDRTYREILSTVSSLGANVEAGKLNRRVLATALITLFVAISTLLVTNPSDNSILFSIIDWMKRP